MKDTTLAPHAVDFFEMNEWHCQEARLMALIHYQAGSCGFAMAFFPGLVVVWLEILYLLLLGLVFILLSPLLVPAIIIDNWIYRSFGFCSMTFVNIIRNHPHKMDPDKSEDMIRIICDVATNLQKYKALR